MIIKNKIRITWKFFSIGLVLASAIFIVSCVGTAQTATPVLPTLTLEPTLAPTATPTVVPTETPVLPPTNTPRPTTQIHFEWDPAGVRPSDADDVAAIVSDVIREEGLVSGYGNEQGITLEYDPAVITVEEIQELLERIGHPVQLDNE